MRRLTLTLAALAALPGCYATHINTRATPMGEEFSDRQLFTLWGLVPLSAPAGEHCAAGVAQAKSKLSAIDILIDAGIGIAAAGAVAGTCNADAATCASRAGAAGTLATGLFGTRTVTYTCAGLPAQEVSPK